VTPGQSSQWVMRAGAHAEAELTLIDHHGRVALLKSFDHTRWLFRWTIARLLTYREASAYVALDGIRGVPRLLERRGPTAFVVELVDGRSCFACRAEEFDDTFFEQLSDLLEHIRSRGILHGDVSRNVINGQDGRPWVVDFGASFMLARHIPWLRARLTNVGAHYDRRAVAKLKSIVAPQLMSDADRKQLAAPMPFESVVEPIERVLSAVRRWVMAPRQKS
jgi:RIO-like serine/threonine protein kinase